MSKTMFVSCCVLMLGTCAWGSDWPQWRGDGLGVSRDSNLPARWTDSDNIRWKIELPGRGVSSPVIANGHVYLTANSGATQERLHVLSFDASTGKQRWERQFWATGATHCHPKTNMAAPTPATNGQQVVALFATCDLVCLDADGTILWYRALSRDYPNISNQVGMAASPIIWKDTVIVSLETDSEACALGIDLHTGENRWRIDRTVGINWVTPIVRQQDSTAELLLQSRSNLTAYDPETGKERWTHPGPGLDVIPSPVLGENEIYVPAGELMALRPGSDQSQPEVLWKSNKLRAATASPILYRDRLYAVNSAGVLTCADPKTGAVIWQERLKGPFSASPIAGDNKLYFVNEEGVTSVVNVDGEERVIATNALGETILASPAIANGAIYFRSDKHLYCVGESSGGRNE